jgi:aldose 1-epimerase
MNSLVSLQCGALRCELRPDLGGCVAGLWWGTQQVLRSTPGAELHSVRVAASYPLLPYSNRIGYRTLHWAGQDYRLEQNFAPEPHAIHGVGWERAWTVEEASATRAVLAYAHLGDAAWPFAFDSRQTVTLTDRALELQLAVTNRAAEPVPMGLGWHPYFAKSANTHIQFAATGRWEMGPDKLPTQRLATPGLDTDCSRLDVDHCFDGWSARVLLSEAGLRVHIGSDLAYLVVYTTPERDSVAIEPVSHVNNALALAQHSGQSPQALGLRVLQPDETFSASMRIQVEPTP